MSRLSCDDSDSSGGVETATATFEVDGRDGDLRVHHTETVVLGTTTTRTLPGTGVGSSAAGLILPSLAAGVVAIDGLWRRRSRTR